MYGANHCKRSKGSFTESRKIFPKNDHFKVTMYVNALLGVWPFIFEDNPSFQKLYNIYARCTFSYFFLFIITAYMELFILIFDDENRVQEIVANLCITLLYSITIMRVYAIKTTSVKSLIREVIDVEQIIYQSNNEEMIRIYTSYVRQSHISNIIFLANIAIETVFYFTHPLYVDDVIKYNAATNQTTVIKALPLSSWFPYDEQKYHFWSYMWHILDGAIGASFVMYTDVFTFSLIIFPIGQMKILMHILRNFAKYVSKVENQLGCGREEASFVTMRECVLKHKEIIRYIYAYNDAMKNIMLLDFLQSSLQLASIVIQFFVTKPTLFNIIFAGEFVMCMLIRLLVYYWYGNEIMVQSSNIASAVWESEWYEEPQKVKQMMLLMIVRSNKALALDIGPFTTMTLSAFLGIMKATYSYMMVMYR